MANEQVPVFGREIVKRRSNNGSARHLEAALEAVAEEGDADADQQHVLPRVPELHLIWERKRANCPVSSGAVMVSARAIKVWRKTERVVG